MEVVIEYFNTYDDIEKSIYSLLRKGLVIVGLDTESSKPDLIDTIQIAVSDSHAMVYQISNCLDQYKLTFPSSSLAGLFSAKEIVKTGVDINCDICKIYKTFGHVKLNSFIDTQAIALTKGLTCRSMNDLGLLLIKGYKTKNSQGGQYNMIPLSASQIQYAGLDAIYSLQIYNALVVSPVKTTQCKISRMK